MRDPGTGARRAPGRARAEGGDVAAAGAGGSAGRDRRRRAQRRLRLMRSLAPRDLDAVAALRLEALGVRPQAQGRGLGRTLSQSFETAARKLGATEIRTAAVWREH